ncbi:Protein of unknown function [Lactobacillus helveticus CIRM-BIA 951]|uniref:Uncharacterized protein n=1 Tax=Lactobacillus helveticus CIRM-BIA 951 TaxID=1226334 RepID=U6F4D6_LACHE|nr:Protein of unknown function [Lactobacillus helveticus CIRM-BIA 951]
MTNKAAKIAK